MKKRRRKSISGDFTARELFDRISRTYEICPTKRFKSQLDIALKRGVSYGLLRKIRNKYRYESSPAKVIKKPKKKKTASKQRIVKATTSTKSIKKKEQLQENRGPSSVPRPTVPPPPDFRPERRHLLNEPFKVIKKPQSF